jgi:subtilisin family serine protease
VLGVGAIRLPDDAPVSTSSKGPSAWEPMQAYSPTYPWPQDPAYWDYPVGGFGGPLPGLLKPDLCGYAEVQTTSPGGGYATFGGTSAATPHVAGAVALLRQVQPHAEPRHLAAALELTAADLGAAGKDNQFGAGKPQVLDAARRLLLLGRLDDTAPALGQDVTLEVFGPGGAPVYAYLGTALADSALGWNLAGLQLFWGLLVLPADGRLALPLAIPDLTPLLGLSLWLQFGTPAGPPGWGSGPLISPPEPLTAAG